MGRDIGLLSSLRGSSRRGKVLLEVSLSPTMLGIEPA